MSWPFSSNSGDPGPVFLSRLFSALSIRPPVDFHSYVTQFPKPETDDSAESRYLSSTQYNDLTTGNREGWELVLGDQRILNSAAPRVASTSPFNEISLFSPFEPNRVASQRTRNSNRLIQITVDQYQILELEERLSKLEGRLPETHPAMLAILEGLYDANNSMANYKLAEHWCRRIITIRQRIEDIYSPQSLLDQVHLMSVLTSQGKSKEAKVLYERLYPHIKRNGSFTSLVTAESLAAESLATQVQIAQALGSNEDAVNYSKQLTQLRLSTLGPYDAASLCAMTLVAESLIDLGIYDESVRILRLMLQLQERCNQFSFRRRCIGMRNLAEALRRQKHYEEGVIVARRSVELAGEFLGSEQHTTLLNMAELGLCLRGAGLLSESEATLRDVVARRVSIFGEDDLSAIVEMGDLGRVLLETSNYEEATIWYEKAFRGLLKASSWRHWLAVVYCRSLGKCYEMQERYVDGIDLYEEAVHGTQQSKETRPHHYCYFIHKLAGCFLGEGRYPEAVCICTNFLQETHHIRFSEYQYQGWERTISAKLAEVYEKQGKFDDAAALYEQNIAKSRGTAGWTYGRRMYYYRRLGECYTKSEQYSDAAGLYSRSMEEIRSLEGPDHSAIAEIQGWIDDLSNQTSHTERQLEFDEDGTLGNEDDGGGGDTTILEGISRDIFWSGYEASG
jgi:tetratricopeptide (TPR) repeat protein